MNRIYNVIWSKVRHCYVVVSELTRQQGKSKTKSICTMAAIAAAFAIAGGLTFGMPRMVSAKEPVAAGTDLTQYVAYYDGQYVGSHDGYYKDDKTGYFVRNGYEITLGTDQAGYTPLSSNTNRVDVKWTGTGDRPDTVLESTQSVVSATGITTNLGETLNQVTAGTYAGVTNSGMTWIDPSWSYVIEDASWAHSALIKQENKSGSWVDLTGHMNKAFVTAGAGSKLQWNEDLQSYIYDGKTVDLRNLYVVGGKIGVFTNADGSAVYTGTVYGKNNEILMTAQKDGKYYSYWGAKIEDDPGATMETYRVADYKEDLEEFKKNDIKLADNDIKRISAEKGTDGSLTLGLMRNGINKAEAAVEGAVTITSGGGKVENDKAVDTYVTVSSGEGQNKVSQTFNTGSKVEANKKDTSSDTELNYLTVNGETFKLSKQFGLSADDGKQANANLGGAIKVTGDGKNIATSVNGDSIKVSLNKDLVIGTPGEKGEAGSIGLVGPAGKDGKDGFTKTIIKTETGVPGVNGADGKDGITRIVYEDKTGKHNVATLDDGLRFAGDNYKYGDKSTVVYRKLNDKLDITGGADKDKLTDNNIGVIASNDGLKIKLSSEITGMNKIEMNENYQVTTDNSVTNKKYVDETVANAGWNLTTNGGTAEADKAQLIKKDQTVDFSAEDGLTISKENTDKGADVKVGLGDKITVGTEDGVVIGQQTVKGNGKNAADETGKYVTGLTNKEWNKDNIVSGRAATEDQLKEAVNGINNDVSNKTFGLSDDKGNKVTNTLDNTVSVKGADGITSTVVEDEKGAKHLEIGLGNKLMVGGKDGTDGKDGSITIIHDNKETTITVNGKDGKDGLDGTSITRIEYKDKDGNKQEVATMNDGLRFAGDNYKYGDKSTVAYRKLNEKLDITGGADKDKLTDNNIGVIASSDGLEVKLAKDVTGLNSVTTKNAYVTNVDTTNENSVTNKKYVDDRITNVNQGLTDKGFGIKAEIGGAVKQKLGDTIAVVGDKNVNTSVVGDKIQIALENRVVLGDESTDQKIVLNGNEGRANIGGVVIGQDGNGNRYVSGLSNTTIDYTGFADGSGRAATEEQLQKAAAGSKTTVDDGKNITVTSVVNEKDGHTEYKVNLNDDITLGGGSNGRYVRIDGNKGNVAAAGYVRVGKDFGTSVFINKDDKGDIVGLTNTTLDAEDFAKAGRAATEEQLALVKNTAENAKTTHTVVTAEEQSAPDDENAYTNGNIQVNKKTSDAGQAKYDVKLNDHIILGDVNDASGHISLNGPEGRGYFGGVYIGQPMDGSGRAVWGLSNTTFNISNGQYQSYKGSDNAATEGQLYDAFDFLNKKIDGITINEVPGHETGGNGGSGSTGETGGTTGGSSSTGSSVAAGSGNIVVTPVKGDNPTDSPKWNLDLNNEKITLGDDKNHVTIEGTQGKVTVTGSYNVGDTVVNKDGISVGGKDGSSLKNDSLTVGGKTYITKDGINANNQKITNVTAGEVSATSTDAVNGSQLYATNMAIENNAVNIQNLGSALSNLDGRVDKVGAGAAALAALHPLDFDPDAKWDFAAGYGNYRSASAVAMGAYYRPNEDTMFSVGGTFGNGENMVNAGVSFKLGSGSSHVTTSRVAMAKEIISLRNTVAQLTAMVNDLAGKRAVVSDDVIDFPDVPENHWAYAYVKKLANMGILIGYPDGMFKGNQTMTRYEFAAITYKALQNGVIVDRDMSKMLAEFKPELELIRVDTIARDKDGNPTIERVRVNK